MKEYVFKVKIREGNDEFWEDIEDSTGIEEVRSLVIDALRDVGVDCEIDLIQFSKRV